MLTKKFALAAASAMLLTTFALAARPAYATAKVDCDAVMNELNSGKHQKEVAKDLNTTIYQVRKCKKHAKEATKAETKSSMQAKSGKEAPAMSAPSSAMGAPSPAMAAPAAAASPK
ncbi:MAG: hypothetical protein ACREQH_10970 [Candidatus Binatus sp.]